MPNEVLESPAAGSAPSPAPAAATPPAASPEPSSAAAPSAGTDGAPGSDEPGKETPKPEAKPSRTFSQEDVNRMVRRARKDAEQRTYDRARLEAENEWLRQQVGAPRGDAPNGSRVRGEKPRVEDFKDWDSYQEAFTDWKVEQKLKGLTEAQVQQHEQKASAEYAHAVRSKMLDGAEKYEDFEAVVGDSGVAITQEMVEAMVDLEVEGVRPCDVAYYLGENPAESQRIAKLPRAKQIREIDKIASKLAKPPEPTKAPDPIKPNAGTSAAVEKSAADVAGNYKEWLKRRYRELGREVPR